MRGGPAKLDRLQSSHVVRHVQPGKGIGYDLQQRFDACVALAVSHLLDSGQQAALFRHARSHRLERGVGFRIEHAFGGFERAPFVAGESRVLCAVLKPVG